tara:strand:+ start:574 stop:1026 length:453 start_codon:yes stop_codon:yes gene_type:complete
MRIWVDADACPRVIKDILFRAAQGREVLTTLVANHQLQVPPSKWLKSVQVAGGFDVADNYIVQQLEPGDLVITADIPLASEAIDRGAQAINPRGEHYTKANIKQRLAMRNLMEELRTLGEARGGPPPLNHQDRQAFANVLDRLLTKHKKY